MALSAQDKILYVANKLGLSTLKNMQGSTGAVYDSDLELSGQIFSSATRHNSPSVTNLSDNKFEVNEALLIENIAFYVISNAGSNFQARNFQRLYGSNAVIVYDLVIGNKRVMKNTPVFGSGSPYTFANTGQLAQDAQTGLTNSIFVPRHQTFMEGAGILIPPQVEFSINYTIYDIVTGAIIPPVSTATISAYLFGTRVLLNFNTTI
jgi:hypothetical protein